jgi:putative transcription factor
VRNVVRCEVCGNNIIGTPYKAIIERAKMTVCWNCANLGSPYRETPPPPQKRPPMTSLKVSKKRWPTVLADNLELVNDYSQLIRQARERSSMSYEDLGKKIGEKISVLRKIENRKMSPDRKLIDKLERTLKIRLLVPFLEQKQMEKTLVSQFPHEKTLAEVIQVKRKKEEER